MYFRKVIKGNGHTDKKYEYLHLVESIRTEEGPRQKLILNLGKLDIDPSLYKNLARRIEDILTRQRSFGGEYLCNSIWKELEMNSFLKKMNIPDKTIPIIESLVVGRLVDPGSERYTKQWAESRSSLFEIAGTPYQPSLNSYYLGGDSLLKLKEELEKHLTKKGKGLFSLEENLFFFDFTNSYFEGGAKGNPKAKFGRSKEKRSDCRPLTMGMIVDELGFAKYSELFPGNKSEPATLGRMVEKMEMNLSEISDKIIVMDVGIAQRRILIG